RRWVPTLPDKPEATGSAARRFDAAVRRAERKAVKLLLQQTPHGAIRGVDADGLALTLGVPTEVAAALLDDWRGRLTCRLQVTRAGRLLHEFPRAAIRGAVSAGWHTWPQRVMLFGVAFIANVGATWWVIVGVASAVVSLGAVWVAEDDETRIVTAIVGILVLGLVFGLAQLGAYGVRMLLAAYRPKMASAPEPRSETAKSKGKVKSGSTGGSSSGSSFDIGDLSGVDFDAGGCGFIILAICVAVLSTAVIGGLVVVFVWLRGLWRTAKRLGEPEVHQSPASWLRTARRMSALERWLPTNDLAMRMVRALGRCLEGRPADDRLAARIMARAGRQGGRVAVIEITLSELLSPDDALSLLARLVARHGGDFAVSDGGDIDAVFPPAALTNFGTTQPTDSGWPPSEYIHRAKPKRLARLAVNLPGLTESHMFAATRLAGGPLVTLVAMLLGLLFAPAEMPAPAGEIGTLALFCLLVPGTLLLSVATRAAVAESARQGLLRDIRRLAIARVRAAVKQSGVVVSRSLAVDLHTSLTAVTPDWDQAAVVSEIEAAWADVGIEPSLERGVTEGAWDVAPLADRLNALNLLRQSERALAPDGDADEIVFDSGTVSTPTRA
ncbi:MAG: hypothetical protein KC502_20305, partial [Myxococcales bacterium]|nr:hypothetical protein [Myxococcales bacterium]